MPRKIARYGWIPDLPDHRDHLFAAPSEVLSALPQSVDMRNPSPEVYDQGQLGSCTANAIAAAIEFDQMREQHANVFVPSRLFIYYNERDMESTVASDSGAMIRDGVKSVATVGACPEDEWQYDISQFANQPTAQCYADAGDHLVTSYQRVTQNLSQMKGCLAAGNPFVFGFSVYDSFESPDVAATGVAPMPAPGEAQIGGHAVMAVGYDDNQQTFLVRNSWGTGWGMAGYFTLPYAYLAEPSLASDFWNITVTQ